jgi:Protein of unknown function (DUF1573)
VNYALASMIKIKGRNKRVLRIQPHRLPVAPALCFAIILAIAFPEPSSVPAAHLAASASGARPAPRAVVPFTSFNFGDIYSGEIISQIFVIKNEGDAELLIKDFKGDCGCTAVRSEKVILPGKEATAEIEVQTVSQSGLINKSAIMHTNDPDQPTIVFSLVANVLRGAPIRQGKYIGPVFVSPDSRGSMYAIPGKTATTQFLVTADEAPVKVLRVEGAKKVFSSRVEVIEPGRSYKILVESLPIETGGLYTDQVRVVTDNPALPAFTIDMALRVYDKQ